VILASEDIGNADPRALQVAVAGLEAFRFIGMPEGFHPLAQVTTYLACAPKSNASYLGYMAARAAVKETGNRPVPMHLRNAPTCLMKELGRSQGYQYPHDWADGVAPGVVYLPEGLEGRRFYLPKAVGNEKRAREFLEWVRAHQAC
jgi:putative ATPase